MTSRPNDHDVVMLSTADWDNPFWTNKQHVAVQLAASGYRVFYIDSLGLRRPSASTQDTKRIFKRLQKLVIEPRKVRENIWVWSPFVIPFQKYSFIRRLNRFLLSAMLKFYGNKTGIKQEILWTYNPLTVHLLNIKVLKKLFTTALMILKPNRVWRQKFLNKPKKSWLRGHTLFLPRLQN